MNKEAMHAVLDWDFVSVMMSQSVVVISVANTIGAVFRGKLSRTATAFIASLLLTFYAAFKGGWTWEVGRVLEVLAYAGMLFCLSAGAQQSVLAVANRVGVRGAGTIEPAAARPRGGWWASWF